MQALEGGLPKRCLQRTKASTTWDCTLWGWLSTAVDVFETIAPRDSTTGSHWAQPQGQLVDLPVGRGAAGCAGGIPAIRSSGEEKDTMGEEREGTY